MSTIRTHSEIRPLNHRPLAMAIEFIIKADSMGLLKKSCDTLNLDFDALIIATTAVLQHGMGRKVVINPEQLRNYSSEDLCHTLKRLSVLLEESPHPPTEWPRLRTFLSNELMASLVGVDESSIRKYSKEVQSTPPDVADRLHWLALTVGDLQGAYGEEGVRSWFKKPRKSFGGQSPVAMLGSRTWSSSDEAPLKIRAFAKQLIEDD